MKMTLTSEVHVLLDFDNIDSSCLVDVVQNWTNVHAEKHQLNAESKDKFLNNLFYITNRSDKYKNSIIILNRTHVEKIKLCYPGTYQFHHQRSCVIVRKKYKLSTIQNDMKKAYDLL